MVPLYPTGAFVYAVKDSTTNNIDNMRTFDVLYLCPNDGGGGYFIYNIATMQRSYTCRVIGINKKPIPMTDLVIDLINMQAKKKQEGLKFIDINKNKTVNDYEEHGSDSDSDFEDDDKLYETNDNLTLDGDHKISDDSNEQEEDQQQHFNVLEVNDIDEEDSDSENKGVGEERVGEEDDPIQDDCDNNDRDSTVHKIKEEG